MCVLIVLIRIPELNLKLRCKTNYRQWIKQGGKKTAVVQNTTWSVLFMMWVNENRFTGSFNAVGVRNVVQQWFKYECSNRLTMKLPFNTNPSIIHNTNLTESQGIWSLTYFQSDLSSIAFVAFGWLTCIRILTCFLCIEKWRESPFTHNLLVMEA